MDTTQQSPETTIRRDIHQEVTDKIIKQLELGVVPWRRSWKSNSVDLFTIPKNIQTGQKYRGVNILLLWSDAIEKQHTTQEWASFKQWKAKDESIRKGEHGTKIIYYDKIEKEIDGEIKIIPFIKTSVVFNRCQLASFHAEVPTNKETHELIEPLYIFDAYIRNTGVTIKPSSDPYYSPAQDYIGMPNLENFIADDKCSKADHYFSVLSHELIHWTGHEKRLNREIKNSFGSAGYAKEEPVAEFGSAFLCAEFGIVKPIEDSASYIAGWLKAIKENKKLLFTASSEGSKAVDYLNGLQPE